MKRLLPALVCLGLALTPLAADEPGQPPSAANPFDRPFTAPETTPKRTDVQPFEYDDVGPKIPNYRLRAAHEEQAMFALTPVVTVRDGFAALRLKLWDEDEGRLVRFPRRPAYDVKPLNQAQFQG